MLYESICTLKKHAGPGISAIRLRAAGYAVLFLCGGIYNNYIYAREDILYFTTIFLAVILSLRMRQRGSSFTFER